MAVQRLSLKNRNESRHRTLKGVTYTVAPSQNILTAKEILRDEKQNG